MVHLNVDDYHENTDVLIEMFKATALQEGWREHEVHAVITEAYRLLDHDHLIETIRKYCNH